MYSDRAFIFYARSIFKVLCKLRKSKVPFDSIFCALGSHVVLITCLNYLTKGCSYDGDSNRVEKDRSIYAVKVMFTMIGHLLTMIYKGVPFLYLTNYRVDILGMTDESGKLVVSNTYDTWGTFYHKVVKIIFSD